MKHYYHTIHKSYLRPTRRSGPDGQIAFDLIAEVVQRRWVSLADGRQAPVRGGATLVLDAWGRIQYIVRKGIASDKREKQVVDYMTGAGAEYWTGTRELALAGNLFRRFCVRGAAAAGPTDAARG
jgi:hypothetical protein